MGDEVLVKKAYLENIAMNTNWCQILNATHKLNTRPLTMIEYHRTAPCRSSENWKAYWKNSLSAQITGSGKLRMYARLKSEFQRDPYLDIPTFEKRQVITKFICSNHSLYIETDRHRDRESSRAIRTCQVCTRGAIEDERHFLIEFPGYETIRGAFLNPLLTPNPKIEEVFPHNEPHLMATYLLAAFKHRDELLTERLDVEDSNPNQTQTKSKKSKSISKSKEDKTK